MRPKKEITQTQEEILADFLKEAEDLRMLFPNLLEIRLNLTSILAGLLLLNHSAQHYDSKQIEAFGFTITVVCDLLEILEHLA